MQRDWIRWILIVLLAIFLKTSSVAQHVDTASLILIPELPTTSSERPNLGTDEIFPPEFPGGEIALKKFITKNISWKTGMKEGKVLVAFTISASGKLKQVRVIQHLSPLNDAEVLKALGMMPKWVPMAKGVKTADGKFNLPITFSKK